MENVLQAMETPTGGLAMLIIDPQVDFHPGGSLAVAGANEDSARIAAFIRKHMTNITQITITLDSHQHLHIAHAVFWKDAQGNPPAPFTLITEKEIREGKWTPASSELKEYALYYTNALEKNGRFTLCIWPEHCIIGSPGHCIVPVVRQACMEWAKHHRRSINYVLKGSNSFTEHYSALQADVEIPSDPHTSLNTKLVNQLKLADKIAICGEALSHCVNFTTRDLAENWEAKDLKKLVILTDCASSVPGFEASGKEFLSDMQAKGLTFSTSVDPVADSIFNFSN